MTIYRLGDMQPTLPEDGSAWIAPSADVIGDTTVGANASIWFGAVVRADNTPIAIGRGSNVQDGAILHSDPGYPLTIGEEVTIGHRAILHGCTIGDRVLIGMGTIILNGAVIPNDCVVGAGSLITERRTFLSGSLIIGSPAVVKRPLSEEEVAGLVNAAGIYVDNRERFSGALRSVHNLFAQSGTHVQL